MPSTLRCSLIFFPILKHSFGDRSAYTQITNRNNQFQLITKMRTTAGGHSAGSGCETCFSAKPSFDNNSIMTRLPTRHSCSSGVYPAKKHHSPLESSRQRSSPFGKWQPSSMKDTRGTRLATHWPMAKLHSHKQGR